MTEERKKPVKLEWQGTLTDTVPQGVVPVAIKNSQAKNSPSTNTHSTSPSASPNTSVPKTLRIRRETKGRGGHPVFILHKISPVLSHSALKDFATKLKSRLGCGGTVEDDQIILQTQNIIALESTLASLKVASERCGGF